MDQRIRKSRPLQGEIRVPGDKSISHRALILAALADGTSELSGFLDAEDPRSTIQCLESLGVRIKTDRNRALVEGVGLHGLRKPSGPLDAGNSGTTMRLLAGVLSGQSFESTLTGDQYLLLRPMKRIMDPLCEMGARILSQPQFTAPLTISGSNPLRPITYALPIPSAQVKSAVLLAGLYADGVTSVIEATPTRDHTERLLALPVTTDNKVSRISISGGMKLFPLELEIPGDISSAAFLIAAGLLVPGSDLILRNVGLNQTRAHVLEVFRSMGGHIETVNSRVAANEPVGDLRVKASILNGKVDLSGPAIPLVIDEIPVIAATSAVAGITFRLRDASELRRKESDRIALLVRNFRAMGLDVDEYHDGFAFESKGPLMTARIETGGDHRIAMAFAATGAALDGEMTITDAESASVSFPGFWSLLLRFQS